MPVPDVLGSGMVRGCRLADLDGWLGRAQDQAAPAELRTFAAGIVQDREAVAAALESPWSNGPVEGQVNRLKTLKRQMYGRAGFQLLQRRVMSSA